MKEFFNRLGDGIIILCKKVSGKHAFYLLFISIICFAGYKVIDRYFDSIDIRPTPALVPNDYVITNRTPVQRIDLTSRNLSNTEIRRRTNVAPESKEY